MDGGKVNIHRIATALVLATLIVCSRRYSVNNYKFIYKDIKSNNEQIEVKVLTATLPSKTIKVVKEDARPSVSLSRGDSVSRGTKMVEFTLTYYSDLPEENGGYTGNCRGEKLVKGMVASNYYPLDTKIYLQDIGTVYVADRGGKSFNNSNRLDVFVPREKKSNGKWETNTEYKRRVNQLGKKKTIGYVLD